ncbi:MAG: hypothetical protein HOP02_16690 [Methylococcaceae bacterium]|nr:hypothetical protein [Methylococcaceae bacterium]
MNILMIKKSTQALLAVSLMFLLGFSQNISAKSPVSLCKDHIQNKIAWDPNSAYETAQKWEQANLDSLCKGTKSPEEPGKCFHHLMTGHVNWGVSDKWEWKNAIALCAGTNNSDERISCFEGRIKDGEKWDAAIFQCQASSSALDNKVPK